MLLAYRAQKIMIQIHVWPVSQKLISLMILLPTLLDVNPFVHIIIMKIPVSIYASLVIKVVKHVFQQIKKILAHLAISDMYIQEFLISA